MRTALSDEGGLLVREMGEQRATNLMPTWFMAVFPLSYSRGARRFVFLSLSLSTGTVGFSKTAQRVLDGTYAPCVLSKYRVRQRNGAWCWKENWHHTNVVAASSDYISIGGQVQGRLTTQSRVSARQTLDLTVTWLYSEIPGHASRCRRAEAACEVNASLTVLRDSAATISSHK